MPICVDASSMVFCSTLDTPKSPSLTRPLEVRKMFCRGERKEEETQDRKRENDARKRERTEGRKRKVRKEGCRVGT